MIGKIKKSLQESAFIPNIFSILRHDFIIRKWIYKWIKNNKNFIAWKVLDFGCGEKPYKDVLTFDKYIGVDFKKSWHDDSQNNVDFFWDWKTLPFENNEFDSIISTEVFEHIFDIDEVLIELNRVLKKWWKIVITIPFVIHEHEIPFDFARYTSFGIRYLLEKHWFDVIKSQKYWSYFDVISQLSIWFLGKITETKNIYLTWFLRIIFAFPFVILGNIISFISPKFQKWLYMSNVVVWEKS